MQVIIGDLDVTSAVQESTYQIDKETRFEEWLNANNVTRHDNVYHKIAGTFDMVFIPGYSIEYSDFLEAVQSNTIADVTNLSLTVNNLDEQLVNIRCFMQIAFLPIRDLGNGTTYKRCTVTIEEC